MLFNFISHTLKTLFAQVTTVTKVLREVHRVDTGQALYSEATPVPGGQYQDIPYGEYGSQEYPNVESYRPSPGICLFL